MANLQHLDILHCGVETWNRWRQEYPGMEPDLNDANLSEVSLVGANLSEVHLERSNLSKAYLDGVDLSRAHILGTDLSRTNLKGANLTTAHLEGANLNGAHLEGANLNGAHLEGATLDRVHLEKATLNGAHLEGATLNGAYLEGAYLSDAFFDNSTRLHNVILSDEEYGSVSLVDVHWGDANLAVVDWTSVKELGDEHTARQMKTPKGMKKYKAMLIEEYRTAVRANRQLVVVLRNQGLNEEADHFAYYAQVLQKTVFGLQILERRVALRQRIRMFFSWLFSWFLYLLAGYGYRPLRSVTAYLLLILTFAVAFYAFGHLRCYEALVVSLTAFHGRGFFSQEYKPSDPQSIIAAVEAVVGLLIEISFIATFTHRFFGK